MLNKIAMIIHYPFKGGLMLLCSLLINMPTVWTENHTPPTPTYDVDPLQGKDSQHQGKEDENDETSGLLHMPWRGPVQPGQAVKAAVHLY